MSAEILHIDAFTSESHPGNRAGVVLDARGLSEADMMRIAAHAGHPETAFVLPPDGPDHDVRLRFFTPEREVPSCGHATIAAHHARSLGLADAPTTIRQKIGAGVLPVEISERDGELEIAMTQAAIEFEPPLDSTVRSDVLKALGLGEEDIDTSGPVQVVSTGHSKVMVPVRRRSRLNELEPDFDALRNLSSVIGSNGYFVFTLDAALPGVLAHGRMFAPAIGIPEDPATGNANGPLGAYLVRHGMTDVVEPWFEFRALQGEAMGQAGVLTVRVRVEDGVPKQVKVAGRARIVHTERIELAGPDEID